MFDNSRLKSILKEFYVDKDFKIVKISSCPRCILLFQSFNKKCLSKKYYFRRIFREKYVILQLQLSTRTCVELLSLEIAI